MMKRFVAALMLTILIASVSALAAPGDFFPFTAGGGIVPPDSPNGPITKCEDGIAKATGKLWGALETCHIRLAMGKLDATTETSCEQAAVMKFFAVKTVGCAPCTTGLGFDVINRVATSIQAQVDNSSFFFPGGEVINELMYCAWPTTPCARDREACSCGTNAGECLVDINSSLVCTACTSGCTCTSCASDTDCGARAFCISDTGTGCPSTACCQ